jgi:hypothetical protein
MYKFLTDFELAALYNRVYGDIAQDQYGMDWPTIKITYPEHAKTLKAILQEESNRQALKDKAKEWFPENTSIRFDAVRKIPYHSLHVTWGESQGLGLSATRFDELTEAYDSYDAYKKQLGNYNELTVA